jgi:magnesium transporter
MASDNNVCLLRDPSGGVRQLDPSDLDGLGSLGTDHDSLIWLDVANPDEGDMTRLRQQLGLHELAVEDLRKRRQRPKIDTYPGQHVIVAYEATGHGDDDGGFALGELHLIVGEGYVVTVHWHESSILGEVRGRWQKDPDAVAATAGGLLYAILDTVADGYFPLLDRFSERIDRVQDDIIGGSAGTTRAVLADVLSIKRRLLELRRVVAPLRDVANALLRRDLALIDDPVVPYYQDLYDHLVRVLDNIDLYREMLAAALDANLSVASNNLNVIVKRLTAFTVILMIPTLIAGIYGMNFDVMPELAWPFGYGLALGLMAVSMAGAFVFFKAHDWF